jgi:hypothetical protein
VVERYQRNQLREGPRLELPHELGHARGLDLEHALGVAPAQQVVGGLIVQGHGLDREVREAAFAYAALGIADDRQRLEPEEVELDQSHLLDAAHVPLGHHVARLGIAVERHQVDQGLVADHQARRVGGGVARQPLEPARRLHQPGDLAVGIDPGAQIRALG